MVDIKENVKTKNGRGPFSEANESEERLQTCFDAAEAASAEWTPDLDFGPPHGFAPHQFAPSAEESKPGFDEVASVVQQSPCVVCGKDSAFTTHRK